jgi:hypothetical protein
MLSRFSSEPAKVKKRIENERKVRGCIRKQEEKDHHQEELDLGV